MKVIFYFNLLIGFVFLSSCVQGQVDAKESIEPVAEVNDSLPIYERLNQKAIALKTYLKSHSSYNQNLVVLIDMRQNSGKYRLFVYDLDSVDSTTKCKFIIVNIFRKKIIRCFKAINLPWSTI